MKVLTLNVGSSSLKFGIYRVDSDEPQAVAEGEIDTRGERRQLRYRDESGAVEQALAGEGDDAALSSTPPRMIGKPPGPLPMTTTLLFADVARLNVASMPRHRR